MLPIHLTEIDSTNRWLRDFANNFGIGSDGTPPSEQDDGLPFVSVVFADHQTAGRGCGTNSWESLPGQNLLFSVLCCPQNIAPIQQFLLLEAMALAVKNILDVCLPSGEEVKVKWPNDIYVGDRKLGGTLTECALSGQRMRWCIIGTGLNINQAVFSSHLPNPVSMVQLTGHTLNLESLLERITSCFRHRLKYLEEGHAEELREEYFSALYRRRGYYFYRDTGDEVFEAEIVSVAPDGVLTLRDRRQALRHYRFKEVTAII